MHIASIEKQVGMLSIPDGLAEALRQARQHKPEPVQAAAELTDLKGLEEAHTLDPDRVAALLADPLDPGSGT